MPETSTLDVKEKIELVGDRGLPWSLSVWILATDYKYAG